MVESDGGNNLPKSFWYFHHTALNVKLFKMRTFQIYFSGREQYKSYRKYPQTKFIDSHTAYKKQ